MTDYEDFLSKVGIPLKSIGLNETALLRGDALRAIELLAAGSAPILGGDVYYKYSDRIDPAYANWYIIQDSSESATSYFDRSIREAIEYIERFPKRENEQPIFVLVVQNEKKKEALK